jgi:hypothetical protein
MTDQSSAMIDVSSPNDALQRLQLGLATGIVIFVSALGIAAYVRLTSGSWTITSLLSSLTVIVIAAVAVLIALRRVQSPLAKVGIDGLRLQLVFQSGRVEELSFLDIGAEVPVRVLVRPPGMNVVSRNSETYWLVGRDGHPAYMITREAFARITASAHANRLDTVRSPAGERGSPDSELLTFSRASSGAV